MLILPSELVAPEVTDLTMVLRLVAEYPVSEISPRPAVAPPVIFLITSPSDDAEKPVAVIPSSASTAPPLIFSIAPESSDELIPHDPREPITVSTISLDAVPTSDAPIPASSICETDFAVITFRTVSFTDKPVSAEALGRFALLPSMDLTRLLAITLMTLIDSALEIPRSDILPCAPSTILGIRAIKSSELSRLAAVTVVFAAVVIVEIWAEVRELESVLLVCL